MRRRGCTSGKRSRFCVWASSPADTTPALAKDEGRERCQCRAAFKVAQGSGRRAPDQVAGMASVAAVLMPELHSRTKVRTYLGHFLLIVRFDTCKTC